MAPRSEKQYEQIREERKKQIMDVALNLISEQGVSNVSIAKIAKQAKISKGLMYNYFKSKKELILEITYNGMDGLFGTFDPNHDGVLTKEELHYFIDGLFEIIKQNVNFYKMYFMLMAQPEVYKIVEPELMKKLGPALQIAANYFAEQGYEDPEAEVRIVIAMLDGICLHYVLDPLHYPLERVKKRIHDLFK